ncbi:MAG: hypothetical protein BWY57_02138 [Betaproteobacteria bacterium ADurb.Bin341]|nr:MAG: hypothetical protein BWY57_02138 [Betaproteobacteria bacterium ADurb.Bin341]
MNYYERYIGDFQRDTGHLSCAEVGVYDRLLDHYYATETPLPKGYSDLCRIARAMDKNEQKAVKRIADEFFPIGTDGLRHQARTDREIVKAQNRIGAAKENGKKGGRPPKTKPDDNPNKTQEKPNGFQSANPPETHAGVHHTPYTNPVNHRCTQSSYTKKGDDFLPATPFDWIEFFKNEHGVEIDPMVMHDRKKFWPLATGWLNAKVTVGKMRAAIAKAKSEAREPIAYLPGYADRVLATQQAPPGNPKQNGNKHNLRADYFAQQGYENAAANRSDQQHIIIDGQAQRIDDRSG